MNELRNINLSMSPIESALLDFILAAKVQCDFDNAPSETPYYIEIACDDGEFAQVIEWQISEANGAR